MPKYLSALSERRSDGKQNLGALSSTQILQTARDPIEEPSKGRSARYRGKEKITKYNLVLYLLASDHVIHLVEITGAALYTTITFIKEIKAGTQAWYKENKENEE